MVQSVHCNMLSSSNVRLGKLLWRQEVTMLAGALIAMVKQRRPHEGILQIIDGEVVVVTSVALVIGEPIAVLVNILSKNLYTVPKSQVICFNKACMAVRSNSNLRLESVSLVPTRPAYLLLLEVLALGVGLLEGYVNSFNSIRKVGKGNFLVAIV